MRAAMISSMPIARIGGSQELHDLPLMLLLRIPQQHSDRSFNVRQLRRSHQITVTLMLGPAPNRDDSCATVISNTPVPTSAASKAGS